MDRNSQQYSTASDNRAGYSHQLRPNSLPIINRNVANFSHVFPSNNQRQNFDKEKLRALGIPVNSSGMDNFGEFIIGDPMLVDQSIYDRTYRHHHNHNQHQQQHDRLKMFSPPFQQDHSRDRQQQQQQQQQQHLFSPQQHMASYSNGNSLATHTNIKDLSPAYLNTSPLFPQYPQYPQDNLSPFKFDSSPKPLDLSPHRGSPFESNQHFRRANPSPLFQPSARHISNERGAQQPPSNTRYMDNVKSRDSYTGMLQDRESVLHMRKSNTAEFASGSFTNELKQNNVLTADYHADRNIYKAAIDTTNNFNRNGLEELQKQLMSNLPAGSNFLRHRSNNSNAVPEITGRSKNDSSYDSYYGTHHNQQQQQQQSKMENFTPYFTGTSTSNNTGKSNDTIVLDDSDTDVELRRVASLGHHDARKRKSPENLFDNLLKSGSNKRTKNWLFQHCDQSIDDLQVKTNQQIAEVERILEKSDSVISERTTKGRKGEHWNETKSCDLDREGTVSSFRENTAIALQPRQSIRCNIASSGTDKERVPGNSPVCDSHDDKNESNRKAGSCYENLNSTDDFVENERIVKTACQNEMRQNETIKTFGLSDTESKQASVKQIETNKMETDEMETDEVVKEQAETGTFLPSTRMETQFPVDNSQSTIESGDEQEYLGQDGELLQCDNESQEESSESSGQRKLAELTREERAIQYAMQKFQEMEEKQKRKKRRRRQFQQRKKRFTAQNLSDEVSEYVHDATLIVEKTIDEDEHIDVTSNGDDRLIAIDDLPKTHKSENGIVKSKPVVSKHKNIVRKKDATLLVKDVKSELQLQENGKDRSPKMNSLDEKISKAQIKSDLHQKSYLLVPSYRGFKDFAPILLEGRTRRRSTAADTEKISKPKFPILVIEQVGEKKNEILVKENEDLDAKIARESLLAENVYDEIATDQDNKAKSSVKQLTCNRMTGETVLHKAARLGYDDIVVIKIKEGADVNARDNAGWTALHESCSRGMTDVVRVLLKYGADPNSCSETGIRPIHDAVDSGNIEVIRLLLRYGADVSTETYSGLKILQLARTEATKDYIISYARDIQENSVLENAEKYTQDSWNFRGSSHVMDSAKDDADEIFSDFPADSDRLVEFETSKVPLPPCFNLPVYNEADHTIGYRNYYKLEDVLEAINTTRHVFLRKHKVELRQMPLAEFVEHIQKMPLTSGSNSCSIDSNTESQLVELVHLGPFTAKKIFDLKTYSV